MVITILLLFFGSFFGSNFSLENLQPLTNEHSGWLTSIVAIVAVAPWAYVGFDNIPQTAEEFNFSPNKYLHVPLRRAIDLNSLRIH